MNVGINYEFAKLLLSNGCNVIIADLALLEAAQELLDTHTSTSPRAIFQKTDVTDWTQLSGLFELADEEFGDLHLVCPGAGIFEPPFSNFWLPVTPPPPRLDSMQRCQSITNHSISLDPPHPKTRPLGLGTTRL